MQKSRSSTTRITAVKPKNVFLKPVILNFRFFKALSFGLKNVALHDWSKVVASAVDLAGALNLAKTPEELAYNLVQRSITKSIFELIGEDNFHNLSKNLKLGESTARVIEDAIHTEAILIDRQFFERPTNQHFLSILETDLKTWLVNYGLADISAENISKRLPSFFQKALIEEWRQNSHEYKRLLDAINSPFARADEREWGWINYNAYLQQQIEESIFDEPFSLAQIYLPLNAYYVEAVKSQTNDSATPIHPNERFKIVVDLEKELLRWVQSQQKNDLHLRVISGGPGSGKSSFARMFAAAVSKIGKTRVLFVPLHLIDASKLFTDEMGRYVKDEGILKHNPLDSENPEPDLLIILDGLDELASQGRLAAETAKDFIAEVDRTLDRKNKNPEIRLKILISGRELIVQESQSLLRDAPRQVLTLLPYFLSQEETGSNNYYRTPTYYDPENLLEHDLRQDWWSKFGLLTGNSNITSLPKSLERSGLNEITTQPLLNYLVALSYTRGKIKFDDGINLNVVYADLVERVYEGAHNKRRHNSIRDMKLEDFRRVLEEIALAAWHGDGRTTTVQEIQELCQASNLNSLFAQFQKGAEAGVTSLLAAFFFRQQGERAISGQRTFVFTHKSFGEYLAACRIVRAVERMVEEINERKERFEKGWNEREALAYWAEICGASACTTYIKQFIQGEFLCRKKNVDTYRVALADLFSHLLEFGMPMEQVKMIINGDKVSGIRTFPEALRQSRNAEESLFVALNATAAIAKTVTTIRQPKNQLYLFGAWLKRIQGQTDGSNVCLAAQSMSYLGLPLANLRIADLQEANCEGANLQGANLEGANCIDANFSSANLNKANFKTAYLVKVNLNKADLAETNLVGANLKGANLEGANLKGANLREANLEKSECNNVNLEGAKLQGANLRGANLQNANCQNANLMDANLTTTTISSTRFEGANLGGTILETENIFYATRPTEITSR